MLKPTYHFVINCTEAELEYYRSLDAEEIPSIPISTFGDLAWCLQGYSILKKRKNLAVSLSNHIAHHAINIVHSNRLPQLPNDGRAFLVCVQGDFPRRRMAHYHLVQNKSQVTSFSSFIPHWIQPGLIGRDPSRKSVETVAYTGQTFNGNFAAKAETFAAYFEPYGIEFKAVPPESWYDLREIDVLVAIRSFDRQPHSNKPASKLFNAWQAGIPFIGGYDSAYRQVGQPGEDYLVAGTAEEVVKAVLQLKNDPALYKKLEENGRKKSDTYNNQQIAQVWEEVLSGPVWQRYQSWRAHPNYEHLRFSTLFQLGKLERQSRKLVSRLRKKTING